MKNYHLCESQHHNDYGWEPTFPILTKWHNIIGLAIYFYKNLLTGKIVKTPFFSVKALYSLFSLSIDMTSLCCFSVESTFVEVPSALKGCCSAEDFTDWKKTMRQTIQRVYLRDFMFSDGQSPTALEGTRKSVLSSGMEQPSCYLTSVGSYHSKVHLHWHNFLTACIFLD